MCVNREVLWSFEEKHPEESLKCCGWHWHESISLMLRSHQTRSKFSHCVTSNLSKHNLEISSDIASRNYFHQTFELQRLKLLPWISIFVLYCVTSYTRRLCIDFGVNAPLVLNSQTWKPPDMAADYLRKSKIGQLLNGPATGACGFLMQKDFKLNEWNLLPHFPFSCYVNYQLSSDHSIIKKKKKNSLKNESQRNETPLGSKNPALSASD